MSEPRDHTLDDGRLFSNEEAVAYLGGPPITVRTIDALVRRRELAFVKIGRAVVFPRTALDEYVAAHTVKAEPNPWGLTHGALRNLRDDRATRGRPRWRQQVSRGRGMGNHVPAQ